MCTYPWLFPYLKGLHLTIDGWRPGCDAKGYRLSDKAKTAYNLIIEEAGDLMPCRRVEEEGNKGRVDGNRAVIEELRQDAAPKIVRAVAPLKSDVHVLKTLLEGDVPA